MWGGKVSGKVSGKGGRDYTILMVYFSNRFLIFPPISHFLYIWGIKVLYDVL